jgi:hypothetical protein
MELKRAREKENVNTAAKWPQFQPKNTKESQRIKIGGIKATKLDKKWLTKGRKIFCIIIDTLSV